jgi:hypothetical protein
LLAFYNNKQGFFMAHDNLFEPVKMGTQALKNRIIMAPLTRLPPLLVNITHNALGPDWLLLRRRRFLFRQKAMQARLVFTLKTKSLRGKPSLIMSMPKAARSLYSYGTLVWWRTKAYSLMAKRQFLPLM